MSKLLTVKELEEQLNLSRSTIYRLRKNEAFPYYEIGGRVLFDLKEVKEWMEEGRRSGGKVE